MESFEEYNVPELEGILVYAMKRNLTQTVAEITTILKTHLGIVWERDHECSLLATMYMMKKLMREETSVDSLKTILNYFNKLTSIFPDFNKQANDEIRLLLYQEITLVDLRKYISGNSTKNYGTNLEVLVGKVHLLLDSYFPQSDTSKNSLDFRRQVSMLTSDRNIEAFLGKFNSNSWRIRLYQYVHVLMNKFVEKKQLWKDVRDRCLNASVSVADKPVRLCHREEMRKFYESNQYLELEAAYEKEMKKRDNVLRNEAENVNNQFSGNVWSQTLDMNNLHNMEQTVTQELISPTFSEENSCVDNSIESFDLEIEKGTGQSSINLDLHTFETQQDSFEKEISLASDIPDSSEKNFNRISDDPMGTADLEDSSTQLDIGSPESDEKEGDDDHIQLEDIRLMQQRTEQKFAALKNARQIMKEKLSSYPSPDPLDIVKQSYRPKKRRIVKGPLIESPSRLSPNENNKFSELLVNDTNGTALIGKTSSRRNFNSRDASATKINFESHDEDTETKTGQYIEKENHQTKRYRSSTSLHKTGAESLETIIMTQHPETKRHRKWDDDEVEKLMEGLHKFGGMYNKWSMIKKHYPDVFKHRKPVDLKDKWRNIEKARARSMKETKR